MGVYRKYTDRYEREGLTSFYWTPSFISREKWVKNAPGGWCTGVRGGDLPKMPTHRVRKYFDYCLTALLSAGNYWETTVLMSHSLPPKSKRSSQAPDLPNDLSVALDRARADFADLEAWELLDDSCRDYDRPDEAAALYTEALASKLSAEALEDVGRCAADFCEEWYEETAPVLEMLGTVLLADSEQTWAFDRLTILLTVSADWEALLAAYDTALASTQNIERKQSLLEEAAKVARDFASKAERASDYLKELLLERLEDEQLAGTLERRLEEQGRHQDLVEIWEARLPILGHEDGLKTRLQIAARHLDHLDDAESAYLSVEEYLEKNGDKDAACDLLEKLANTDSADQEVRRQALQILDQLHSAEARWAEVISAIERSLRLAETEKDKVALYRRAVELLTKVEKFEDALSNCAAILTISPDAEDIRVQARQLAERVSRWDIYADAIVLAADGSDVAERRVELLVEAAQVRCQYLQDSVRATELYFRVERDEAADEASRLLACQELSILLLAAERSEDLLSILEKRANLETKAEERSRILGEAASLARTLEHGERALGLWTLRLEDEPNDLVALSAKIELLQHLSKHEALVEALLARAGVGDDKGAQREDLVRAAGVYAGPLEDLENGIACWNQVEARFGRVPESFDSVVALALKAEKYGVVVQLLVEGIEAEVDPERSVIQLALLGDTQRLHLGELEESLVSYTSALQVDPRCDAARSGLRALLDNPKFAYQAGEALAETLRRAEDFVEIVGLIESRLSSAPDDEFRARVLLEAAEIEEQFDNQVAAMVLVARAFALLPGDRTETELHRLSEVTGDWNAAVSAYSNAIGSIDDEARIGALYLARGRVEEDQLGRPEAAALSYRAAVERAPSESSIVHALVRAAHRARLFAQAAWAIVENSKAIGHVSEYQLDNFAALADEHCDWEGTLESMADRIATAEQLAPQVAHDLKKQLAIWYRDKLGDPDSAEMILKRAVKDFPQKDSLGILADLQRRSPGRPLVITLTALADVCGDELSVLREAGEVALISNEDKDLALPILERSLRVATERFIEVGGGESEHGQEASDIAAWSTDHLVKAAIDAGTPELAVELLEKSALLPFTADEQVIRRFRAAQVAAEASLKDRALGLCEVVLAADAKHEGAIDLLSSLYEQAGRLEQLLKLRANELSVDRPLGRRLFLRLDQSRVFGQMGASTAERVTVLSLNLQDCPGHEESIEALSSILASEEEFEKLASVWEEQAGAISDKEPSRAAALWERAGILAEERLQDVARLAINFKRSAAACAGISVLDRLALIAEEKEEWESEVSWLQLRLSLTPEVEEKAEATEDRRQVVVRLGKALVRSDERESARDCLELELAKDAPADSARQLLASIYRELAEWGALSALLTAGVEYVADDAQRIAYLKAAAQVERKRLGNLDAAIPLLERAISLDDNDRSLKLVLADTLRSSEKYEEAALLLTQLLEEFGRRRTKERAIVHTQLARIARSAGDLDEALEQAEAAAKIERTDPSVLMLVGQLAREKGHLERAEQAYRTLALIASRKTKKNSDDEAEEVGESAILFELYRIAEERGDEVQSRELLDSALEVATRDANEAVRLAESLLSSGQIDLLLDALQARLDSGLTGTIAAGLLVTKSNVLEQSERHEDSLLARMQAITHSPQDGLLIESTRKLAEKLGAKAEFWSHLIHLAETNEAIPAIAGDLWYRVAHAAETEEGDMIRAAELFELAQLTGYKARRSFVALDRVLDAESEPERMQQILLRFVSADGVESSPDILADALYRLGRFNIAGGALEDAALHLGRALEVDAQDRRVLDLLEPAIQLAELPESVVALFLRVSRKAGSPETLLIAFRKAACFDDVSLGVLDEALTLSRSLEDNSALRYLLSRAIEVVSSEDDVALSRSLMVERAGLFRADGQYALEADLLEQAIVLHSGTERFELELKLAVCIADDLGRLLEGQEQLEELLKDAPHDSRVWRPLLSIYRETGRVEAVEELIEKVEGHVSDEGDLEALKMERIRLMVQGDRLEEAETELRATLEARPHMSEAATILADLLRKAERWVELKELVERLYDQARDRDDEKLVIRFGLELAELVHDEDREAAIGVLTAGLSVAGKNRKFLTYLLSIYLDEDNQSERADAMELLLAIESGPEARDLSLKLYALRDSVGDEYGAGRALEMGVRAAPSEEALVQRYVDYLGEKSEHARLVEIVLLQGEQAGATEAGAKKYEEAAKIYDEELGDPENAARAIAQAYQCDSSNLYYLEKGAQYLVRVGKVNEALALLKTAIEKDDEMALADLLELRAKIIYEDRPGDLSAMLMAAGDLKLALEQLIPEEQEDTLVKARIDVLNDLRDLHQSAEDAASERLLVTELAEVLKESGDGQGGINTLASWLRDHEEDAEIALQLGETASAAADHATAVYAYEKLVGASTGPAKVDAVLLLADAADSSGSPMDARVALEEAFSADSGDERLRARLRSLYEAAGAYQELAAILLEEAEKNDDDAVKSSLLVEVGDLYLQGNDGESACGVYERAKEITSSPYLVTSKLAEAYILMGKVDQAESVLQAAVETHGKRRSPELALLQRSLARVAQATGNDDGMFAWLEAALMSDRNNGHVARELAIRGQEQGRYEIAIKALQSLTLSKVVGPMSKAEAYFRQAQIAQVQGDTKKALLMARRAHSTDAALDGVSELLGQLGA